MVIAKLSEKEKQELIEANLLTFKVSTESNPFHNSWTFSQKKRKWEVTYQKFSHKSITNLMSVFSFFGNLNCLSMTLHRKCPYGTFSHSTPFKHEETSWKGKYTNRQFQFEIDELKEIPTKRPTRPFCAVELKLKWNIREIFPMGQNR